MTSFRHSATASHKRLAQRRTADRRRHQLLTSDAHDSKLVCALRAEILNTLCTLMRNEDLWKATKTRISRNLTGKKKMDVDRPIFALRRPCSSKQYHKMSPPLEPTTTKKRQAQEHMEKKYVGRGTLNLACLLTYSDRRKLYTS